MAYRGALPLLFAVSLAVLLAGCTMTDTLSWFQISRSVELPGEVATAVPPAPRLVRFAANPQTVDAAGRVTVAWELENAESALLRLSYPGGVSVEYADVPLVGSVTVDIPSDATGTLTAQLLPAPLPASGAFGILSIPIAPGSEKNVVIEEFASSTVEARPGQTINLDWSITGASGASLVAVLPDGSLSTVADELPTEGSQSFTFPEAVSGTYSFQLWPLPGTLSRVMGEVSVSVSE